MDNVVGLELSEVGAIGGALRCSFCKMPRREVAKLVAGPDAAICDVCVRLVVDIMDLPDVLIEELEAGNE